jgi:hypothetical protein
MIRLDPGRDRSAGMRDTNATSGSDRVPREH